MELTCIHRACCFVLQEQQSHRLVILAAIFVLMTLLILYGSNNGNDSAYAPFHVVTNYAIKATDLKKWSGKDGYVPFHGNKVPGGEIHACTMTMCFRRSGTGLNTFTVIKSRRKWLTFRNGSP